jgi:hypothetical protein
LAGVAFFCFLLSISYHQIIPDKHLSVVTGEEGSKYEQKTRESSSSENRDKFLEQNQVTMQRSGMSLLLSDQSSFSLSSNSSRVQQGMGKAAEGGSREEKQSSFSVSGMKTLTKNTEDCNGHLPQLSP